MNIRNLLLVGAALPLLGACVAYTEPYGYSGGPGYYDAYPSSTYIEYNQSYSHRGGYRENYWARDRAREESYHNDHHDNHYENRHDDDHGNWNHGGGNSPHSHR